jgi:hypothetical protein
MKNLLQELSISKAQFRRIVNGKNIKKPHVIKKSITDKTYTFGVVSDTHLCSIHEKLNELHTFYEVCRKEEIKDVFHAGD